MKITLVTVGKIKEKYLEAAIAEYSKRLGRYCRLEIVQVADEKTPDKASELQEAQIRDKEGERILAHIKEDAYVIALAIDGKQRSRCKAIQDRLGMPSSPGRAVYVDTVRFNLKRINGFVKQNRNMVEFHGASPCRHSSSSSIASAMASSVRSELNAFQLAASQISARRDAPIKATSFVRWA